MNHIEEKLTNLELEARTTTNMTTSASGEDLRQLARQESGQVEEGITAGATAAATDRATSAATAAPTARAAREAFATPQRQTTTTTDGPLYDALGGFPRDSAKDQIEKSARAYLRIITGGLTIADTGLPGYFRYQELFSPWHLSSVVHIKYERKEEAAARRLVGRARACTGQVRGDFVDGLPQDAREEDAKSSPLANDVHRWCSLRSLMFPRGPPALALPHLPAASLPRRGSGGVTTYRPVASLPFLASST